MYVCKFCIKKLGKFYISNTRSFQVLHSGGPSTFVPISPKMKGSRTIVITDFYTKLNVEKDTYILCDIIYTIQ